MIQRVKIFRQNLPLLSCDFSAALGRGVDKRAESLADVEKLSTGALGDGLPLASVTGGTKAKLIFSY